MDRNPIFFSHKYVNNSCHIVLYYNCCTIDFEEFFLQLQEKFLMNNIVGYNFIKSYDENNSCIYSAIRIEFKKPLYFKDQEFFALKSKKTCQIFKPLIFGVESVQMGKALLLSYIMNTPNNTVTYFSKS